MYLVGGDSEASVGSTDRSLSVEERKLLTVLRKERGLES